jgi:outer membrane protein W
MKLNVTINVKRNQESLAEPGVNYAVRKVTVSVNMAMKYVKLKSTTFNVTSRCEVSSKRPLSPLFSHSSIPKEASMVSLWIYD